MTSEGSERHLCCAEPFPDPRIVKECATQLNLYLCFNGQCEPAFIGGMAYEGSPMAQQVPPERLSKIMHARLRIGDETLMGSDSPPDRLNRCRAFR